MTEHETVVVAADADDAARLAAERIVAALAAAVQARGRADWATTGGSAAPAIYRHLIEARLRDAVDWAAVHVWWGDDRYVPRDHPLSNVRPLDDILLDADHGIAIPIANLHPFRTGEGLAGDRGAAWTASALADELAAEGLPTHDGWPVLDLVLLGIGSDGHLLSVFPGSAAFGSTALALAIPAPTHVEPHVERVTMNPALIGAAREVLVVVPGSGKADIIAEILGAVRDPRRWPGQLARRPGATWILDEDAAVRLGR